MKRVRPACVLVRHRCDRTPTCWSQHDQTDTHQTDTHQTDTHQTDTHQTNTHQRPAGQEEQRGKGERERRRGGEGGNEKGRVEGRGARERSRRANTNIYYMTHSTSASKAGHQPIRNCLEPVSAGYEPIKDGLEKDEAGYEPIRDSLEQDKPGYEPIRHPSTPIILLLQSQNSFGHQMLPCHTGRWTWMVHWSFDSAFFLDLHQPLIHLPSD